MTDFARGTSPSPQQEPPAAIVVQQHSSPAVWWVIAVSLAVIAACLLMQSGDGAARRAVAQSVGTAGAQGIFAFTGQLSKDSYGVFMVDVDAGTIWCYRFQSGKNVLKLVAARDWRYDRYLQDYATDPPTDNIKYQLEKQRAAALQSASP